MKTSKTSQRDALRAFKQELRAQALEDRRAAKRASEARLRAIVRAAMAEAETPQALWADATRGATRTRG